MTSRIRDLFRENLLEPYQDPHRETPKINPAMMRRMLDKVLSRIGEANTVARLRAMRRTMEGLADPSVVKDEE